MPDEIQPVSKKSLSADWLVRGVLTRVGEIFDRFTGRSWKPSSSLATSELIERLKKLLDTEAKDLGEKGKVVPHLVKLKMQWDKFSTDSETSLKKLENELLTAAVDHINDQRYYTYAPLQLEIKPDYFTEGVKILASFDRFDEDEREAVVNVSVPDLKNIVIAPAEEKSLEPEKEFYSAEFTVQGKTKKVELAFAEKQRLSVGRTKENDLQIDDASVSKIHAALVLNSERQLMVADTGSTNGTFINNQRIAYGKAILINSGGKLNFGTIEVALRHIPKETLNDSIEETKNTFTDENSNLSENGKSTEKILAENNSANDFGNEEIASPTESRIVLDLGEKQ